MIFRLWLKILGVVALIAIPILLSNFYFQNETLRTISSLDSGNQFTQFADDYMALLKKAAKQEPGQEPLYKEEFSKALDSKIAASDLSLVKESIADQLLYQTLQMTLIVLVVAFIISFLLSRNIVNHFGRLQTENLVQTKRLQSMNAIKNWQRLARSLVHELRSPLTPLKLVTGDIQTKYEALDPRAFSSYLKEGSELIASQIQTIEEMIENFLQFAKMPEVKKTPTDLDKFIERFTSRYRELDVHLAHSSLLERPIEAALDENLTSALLFNLIRNAMEANEGRKISVTITTSYQNGRGCLWIRNTGALIPLEMTETLFDPYVSSKQESGKLNLGLGLTIAKKIALDHGGDLVLKHNDPGRGVVFEFSFLAKEKTV